MEAQRQLLASKIALKRSENNEKQLTLELAEYFQRIETEVQKLLQTYGNNVTLLNGQLNIILSPIRTSNEEYYNIIRDYILQEYNLGTAEGDRLVQYHNPSIVAAEVVNEIRRNNLFGTLQYSEQKLLNETFTASQHTINRVDETINKIITDGYKSGKGINHVAKQLQQKFHQLKTWEAIRIARTEIHSAHNQGIMKSYETLGVNYTQWKSAHDHRVRGHRKTDKANHIIMDGEIIPFGGKYSNGLSYPGDKSGKIEEWINCRCSHAPFVIPLGYMAPPGMSSFHESDLVKI